MKKRSIRIKSERCDDRKAGLRRAKFYPAELNAGKSLTRQPRYRGEIKEGARRDGPRSG